MRHLFREVRAVIEQVAYAAEKAGTLTLPEKALANITVEPPRDASHGDISTNIAMLLAKPNACAPRVLADALAPLLQDHAMFTSASCAGPGFINLTLAENVLHEGLSDMLEYKEQYAPSDMLSGNINVEYVSANPTGPMHIGHARGAVFGDALAALLERAGARVTREYYINDAGSQIDTVVTSVLHRYRELLGQNVGAIPEGCYPGEYVIDIAKKLRTAQGDGLCGVPEQEYRLIVRGFAIETIMEMIRSDLALLSITHDVFTSEQALADKQAIPAVIKRLKDQGLIYEGVLDPPKGKMPDDWEARPQTLFKATEFGDDIDRALAKSDGSHTYFAGDTAYHEDKIARGFDALHIVLGADHGGYVKRLTAVTKALSDDNVPLHAYITQIVRYLKDGDVMKMSKRAGVFATVRDVVDELGADIIRFMMLTRKNDAPLDFDIDLARSQSKENPVFYVQYAYARASSVLRQANETMPQALEDKTMRAALSDYAFSPSERALLLHLLEWPRALEFAARTGEPHRISDYIRKSAQLFHSLWTDGNKNAQLRFIVADNATDTAARMGLIKTFLFTMASSFGIVGITPREEM